MKITLRQLQYLIALGEARHFGRAAESVHVSQPALSVQIRDLEAAIGTRLVERKAREAVLTPAGREVVARARRVMEEVQAIAEVGRQERGLTGQLTLGVIPTVAPYLLPAALPLIRARNSALDLRVREAQTAELIAELQGGTLDAAVIALPSKVRGLSEHPLFTDRFLLAGSAPRVAALEGATPRPEEMDPDSLLLLEEGHCLADQALEVCGLDRSRTQVDLGASSLSTLCGLVAGGFGVTLVPELAACAEQRMQGLALTRFAAPEPCRTIGLVTRETSGQGAWVEELADLLKRAGTETIAAATV
ncbi:LysR substrate-binding domain-containing protein [Pontivivens ytuae]|uniref:LysR family transcriptional regulator n=1 Tax=Pontivivens ytuae TaxID=2789856 RepID=A0A7S9QCA7_9RHOB|nr:LysR substrate-binding domain-containing protein [Pontivivens ytuae]QPH53630.1 LysR family transcriptional regulator [Pontivivens ytuae]